ncbi:thymocyte nuclear protein 1 [Rhizoctonia solani]|uniref:Thymocyte nuclear protein 1 n=1 Tax=Rhizoctonia solani TaxID=456999 RepID=A0A8H8NQ75_9AGAM|nr:thymocyte nuclear protein 1 [Rhizoctonia solani]QRW16461.1 thymocyte nuclear protein 1 [Rhizoctonia solani]
MSRYWLMKAEPDSRIVKGKDVKFSVDDFEACVTTAWEGVRNHEAKNIMRDQMKVGDNVLFYHSNCKTPGIAAFAEASFTYLVSKEAFPDYTANDPTHPYYDAKSSSRDSKSEPTWWMVELKFKSRLKHFVSLATLRSITSATSVEDLAQLSSNSEDRQNQLSYLTKDDLKALGAMPLLNRGRLSVQPVNEGAGGWDEQIKPKSGKGVPRSGKPSKPRKPTKRKVSESDEESGSQVSEKRNAKVSSPTEVPRRSNRRKT